MLFLELHRADVAERRMQATSIANVVDEPGKLFGDVVEGLKGDRTDRLDFECLHEAHRLGVIVRVSAPAHQAD